MTQLNALAKPNKQSKKETCTNTGQCFSWLELTHLSQKYSVIVVAHYLH